MASRHGIVWVRLRLLDSKHAFVFQNGPRRSFSLTATSPTVAVVKSITGDRAVLTTNLGKWLRQYEDIVGLSEVRAAQDRVIEAQSKFMTAQEQRRESQREIQGLQQKLKDVHAELDKTSRGEDRYLHLVTQEHALIKREKQLMEEFSSMEKAEREYFSLLSSSVRASHEKERAQAERTKYWSVIGSVCGAVIGIVGTSVNNWLRMRELRGIVQDSSSPPALEQLVTELSDAAKVQHNNMALFVADLKALLGRNGNDELKASIFANSTGDNSENAPSEQLIAQTSEILTVVKQQESSLTQEMRDIKALIAAANGVTQSSEGGSAVYIGRDMERLVKDAEENLEWKIKLNALATVATIYGGLALTVPLIFKAFGGV